MTQDEQDYINRANLRYFELKEKLQNILDNETLSKFLDNVLKFELKTYQAQKDFVCKEFDFNVKEVYCLDYLNDNNNIFLIFQTDLETQIIIECGNNNITFQTKDIWKIIMLFNNWNRLIIGYDDTKYYLMDNYES